MKTSGKVVGHHSCIGMLIVFFFGGGRKGGSGCSGGVKNCFDGLLYEPILGIFPFDEMKFEEVP